MLAQVTSETIWLITVALAVLFIFSLGLFVAKRYKRCPSNKVLVIYGRVQKGESSRCLHGGGAFIWPLIQNYAYLSLDPMQIEIPLRGALSMENIRVNVPSVFTVAISAESPTRENAAIRLLGMASREIVKQAEDIIFGQLRQVIASMRIEDINRDRDKFLLSIQESLEPELAKIGLVLINVNITDITDESGYIEAIGKKAASEAIQQAAVDVAQQRKYGAIGVAEAEREKEIEVANAQKLQEIGTKEAERDRSVRVAELYKDQVYGEQKANYEKESLIKASEQKMRVQVADADAKAVAGENIAKAEIADSNAVLKVKQAAAFQTGETRKREADAAVRQAQYIAEAKAAKALAQKIEEEKRAEFEAVAKARKAQTIVEAEAQGEKVRIDARARAEAIYAQLEAKARGEYEVLAKKGEGLKRIVDGCGGAQAAFQLLMLEEMQGLAETAATAISKIKFDKVIVWDGGNNGSNGQAGGTAGFLRSLTGALPPMMKIMREIGGVEMPEFFGKIVTDELEKDANESDAKGVKLADKKPKADSRSTARHRKPDGTGS